MSCKQCKKWDREDGAFPDKDGNEWHTCGWLKKIVKNLADAQTSEKDWCGMCFEPKIPCAHCRYGLTSQIAGVSAVQCFNQYSDRNLEYMYPEDTCDEAKERKEE